MKVNPVTEETFGKEFEDISSIISEHKKFLILGHIDPDGDCIGSMLAFAQYLSDIGKEVACFAPGQAAEGFFRLPKAELFITEEELKDCAPDVIFALDTPTPARTADLMQPGENHIIVNIDHHPTNRRYGNVNVVDERAAATAVLVFRFLSAVDRKFITADVANCLYLGILLDTGGFRFQNTNAEALYTAAELVEFGADPHSLAHEFIYVKYFRTLKLLASVLGSLTLHCGGKVAFMEVSMEMLERNGGSMRDTEGFVDYAAAVDDVELSAFFREMGPAEVRVSLRSRNNHDVALLAEKYGGGGHRKAAGLTINRDLESSKDLIIKDLENLLAGNDHPCSPQ